MVRKKEKENSKSPAYVVLFKKLTKMPISFTSLNKFVFLSIIHD